MDPNTVVWRENGGAGTVTYVRYSDVVRIDYNMQHGYFTLHARSMWSFLGFSKKMNVYPEHSLYGKLLETFKPPAANSEKS